MKLRIILLSVLAALVSTIASAIPAHPGVFKYTQPDGTVIELQRHGDEFFNWTTLAGSDQVMVLGEDGFYRPGSIDPVQRAAGRKMRNQVNQMRVASLGKRSTHNNNPMTHGARHIPAILVEFTDLSFSITDPVAKFDALLNEEGYSANGATGSVRDYYYQNSDGAFTPIFDVYGPVKLSHNMAYYGESNDAYAAYAVAEGCRLLDDQIDFSNYDYDNDGVVDMILMYYPGYNEAEGGSKATIWPHQWYVNGVENVYLDGKYLSRYFTTSEYKGNSGKNMCSIGTTTHEFGHSIGLPDFYDTDYEDNGTTGALYSFSTMCGGSYNNNSCTPPYFNAEERIYLGWMSPEDYLPLPNGDVSFESIRKGVAYRSNTSTDGEYFIYECRDKTGWDQPLPSGMLIYHADKSKTRSVGGVSPYDLWNSWENYNSMNNYGEHPCFYLIPSGDPTSLNYPYGSYYSNQIIWPGSSNNRTYVPIDWEGEETAYSISDIRYSSGKVSMTVQKDTPATSAQALSARGYNVINPGDSYTHKNGETFYLELFEATGENKPESVTWSYDGETVEGSSVTLSRGTHTVRAELVLSGARTEILELVLSVE